MMGKYRCYLFGIIFATALAVIFPAAAQTTIAISDFSNRSDKFYLDTWETKIPEFLKSELSRSPQLVLVERNHIKAVLDEQALSLSGLIDTSTVQEFGKLAGAEYVITGTIHEDGSRIRIDAHVINVSSGKTISEKVLASSPDYLSEMVSLLGSNLRHQLTGSGDYREKITLKRYPTAYFLVAGAAAFTATAVVHKGYIDRRDDYRSATGLEEIERRYDDANRYNRIRLVLASATGAALFGAFYCWLRNRSPEEILAGDPPLQPYLALPQQGGYGFGIQVHF